jgi:hypothetical protein
MPERSARKAERIDPLLEAFIELARAAIRADREAASRRAKITLVDRATKGGKAA